MNEHDTPTPRVHAYAGPRAAVDARAFAQTNTVRAAYEARSQHPEAHAAVLCSLARIRAGKPVGPLDQIVAATLGLTAANPDLMHALANLAQVFELTADPAEVIG